MNKRKRKKKYKKILLRRRLVIRAPGMFGGYKCPTCGRQHVKEPYCPRCNQNLCYEKSEVNEQNYWKSNDEWEKRTNGLAIEELSKANIEWDDIWKKIYEFQKTIPVGLEVTEENAKSIGVMIVVGKNRELLFINKELSHRLFAYRISH